MFLEIRPACGDSNTLEDSARLTSVVEAHFTFRPTQLRFDAVRARLEPGQQARDRANGDTDGFVVVARSGRDPQSIQLGAGVERLRSWRAGAGRTVTGAEVRGLRFAPSTTYDWTVDFI